MSAGCCVRHSAQPEVGEFVWRPGVVTEALQQGRPFCVALGCNVKHQFVLGRWLVLEDVDRVPAEAGS